MRDKELGTGSFAAGQSGLWSSLLKAISAEVMPPKIYSQVKLNLIAHLSRLFSLIITERTRYIARTALFRSVYLCITSDKFREK